MKQLSASLMAVVAVLMTSASIAQAIKPTIILVHGDWLCEPAVKSGR